MSLLVQTADGRERELPRPLDSAEILSAWLEAHGHPLNTRCGGRGLCHGCRVELSPAPPQVRTDRACQLAARDLPSGTVRIQIPVTSRRDATLHGVTAFELLRAAPPPPAGEGLGLALDLGTTTVAGALWDLRSGRCLAETSAANAQRRHGDNVVARIAYAVEQTEGLAQLRRALVEETLRPLLSTLARAANVSLTAVARATAAGNPTMLHTLAGASLHGLATYPFRPEFLDLRRLPPAAHDLGFPCALELLPGLGPFVGSDISAGALACDLVGADGPALLVDFGTNGEILLRHDGGFLATATAAGPAFEGGRLACGAPARPGVISSLDRANGAWTWTTVGGAGPAAVRPSGISGAAYVDFLAVARREGLINAFGRLDPAHPEVAHVPGGAPGTARRVALAPDIYVTEADVAELLQAKAAIAAGIATLLELAQLQPADLRAVYVAGGFGYHLRPAHARTVGLLPAVPFERVRLVGNTSLGGASLLLHPQVRAELAPLLERTQTVELNQVPTFADHFADALALPEG